MEPSNSWEFWLLILIGNGVVMTLVTMFQQSLFHKQSLEFEEEKRNDYFICRNYDQLFEAAKILYQIIKSWWLIVYRVRTDGEPASGINDLWSYELQIYEKSITYKLSYAKFLKQYYYLIPDALCIKLIDASDEYKKSNFTESEKLIIDAELLLSNYLGIETSQDVIKKRFELISQQEIS